MRTLLFCRKRDRRKGRNASHSSRTLLSRPLRKAEDALRLGM